MLPILLLGMVRINRFSITSPSKSTGCICKALSFVWFTFFLVHRTWTQTQHPPWGVPTKALLHFARGRHGVTAKLLHPLSRWKMPSMRNAGVFATFGLYVSSGHAMQYQPPLGVGAIEWQHTVMLAWKEAMKLHPTTMGLMFFCPSWISSRGNKHAKKCKQPRMILTQ